MKAHAAGKNTKIQAHLLINGRVQGVFFRSEIAYRAKKLGVQGWVRNLSNGKLEAVFEGERKKVLRLVKFCEQGPSGARVTGVNVEWKQSSEEFADFIIRY